MLYFVTILIHLSIAFQNASSTSVTSVPRSAKHPEPELELLLVDVDSSNAVDVNNSDVIIVNELLGHR